MESPFDMNAMIADYMENGFLENIIDLFKQDRNLFQLLGALIADERGRVRVGAVALVEALNDECKEDIAKAIPVIAEKLKDPNPTIRADAAFLLGKIGNKDALPYLSKVLDDNNPLVRETIKEIIAEIST